MQNQYSHSRSYAPQIHHLSGRPPHSSVYYPTSPPSQTPIPHFPTSLPPSEGARPVYNCFQPAGLPVYPKASNGRPHRIQEHTRVPTPIYSSASHPSPASPHQPSWTAAQHSHYPLRSFDPPRSFYPHGEHPVSQKRVSRDSLPEETSKIRRRESCEHIISRPPTEKRATAGDATTDGVPRGPPAKKILLGIERKGKELKRQISGEVRKLAGGSRGLKKADLSVKSFLPRMERNNREEVRIHSVQAEAERSISSQIRAHTGNALAEDFGESGEAYSQNPRVPGGDIDNGIGTKNSHRQIPVPPQSHKRRHDKPTAAEYDQSLNQSQPDFLNVTASTGTRQTSLGAEQPAAHQILQNAVKLPSSYPRKVPLYDSSAGESRAKLLGQDYFKHQKSPNLHVDSNRQGGGQSPGTNYDCVQPTAAPENADNRKASQNMIDLTAKTPTPSALEFWAEADSTLSSAPPNFYDQYHTSQDTFWAEADRAVQVPPWKKHGPSLEEWIANLPGVGDGAGDSKVFQAENKLKKKKPEPEIGVLRVVNGDAEDEDDNSLDKGGNEAAMEVHEDNNLPSVVDKTLLHPNLLLSPLSSLSFPRPFEPGGMEILQEASRETSLHTPTVMGGVSANKKPTHLSQINVEANNIEEDLRNLLNIPLPTEKIQRPADIAREVSNRLEALERHWNEQGLTAGTVLKRMLRIVDTMVVKEREEGQRERRAQEMGWAE